MAKTNSQSTETANAALDIERMADAGQKSMFAFAHLHQRLMRNALQVNAEILDFARKRVDEDIRTSDRLTRCDNVNDAMEVMSSFYQKAFEAYADEANQLMRLGSEAARTSIEEMQRETRHLTGTASAS